LGNFTVAITPVVLQKLIEDRKLLGKEIDYAPIPKISDMNLIRF